MQDLISREAALDALGERPLTWTGGDYELGCRNQYDTDRLAIETVPSAQPESESAEMLSGKVWDEWCTGCKEYDQERHCCPRFNRVIRETLDEVKNNQWIPCSEQLPEEDNLTGTGVQYSDYVLMTVFNEEDDETVIDYGYTVDGEWHSLNADIIIPNWWKVIAWMPLPEPYKEGE